MERVRKRIMAGAGIVLAIAITYLVLVYSSISFISKWRTIYIETAMSTMTKQWLATAFIPKGVIDGVLSNKSEQEDKIKGLIDQWQNVKVFNPEEDIANEKELAIGLDSKDNFLNKYYEIDKESFDNYICNNTEVMANGYDKLMINKSDLEDFGTDIRTIQGDTVLVLDAVNGIMIVEVKGEGYRGRLAIIKNPEQVRLGVTSKLGTIGERIPKIVENSNAILGINASGFQDTNWEGNGGTVVGLLVKDGKLLNEPYGSKSWVMVGFDYDNNLRIGYYKDTSIFRDAVQFTPPLVLNGEKTVEGTAGWGIAPRTSVGQTNKGEVLLLTIDGRQPGWSIGATMEQCADVMIKYNALQAAAMDGGSSTAMIYDNKMITKPATKNPEGRHIPNGFVVMAANKELRAEVED